MHSFFTYPLLDNSTLHTRFSSSFVLLCSMSTVGMCLCTATNSWHSFCTRCRMNLDLTSSESRKRAASSYDWILWYWMGSAIVPASASGSSSPNTCGMGRSRHHNLNLLRPQWASVRYTTSSKRIEAVFLLQRCWDWDCVRDATKTTCFSSSITLLPSRFV